MGLRSAVNLAHALAYAKGGEVSPAMADAIAEEPEQAAALHYRLNADRTMQTILREFKRR